MTEPSLAAPVAPADWTAAMGTAEADGFRYFDLMSVVDEADGTLTVVVHLWSLAARRHRFLRTSVPSNDPRLPSIAAIFPGAAWHEREAAEMFGLTFSGAPDTRPLLLPDGFAGHPLRKDFPLASRAVAEWPGAHEPGEHGPAARPPGRRRAAAPGVPDWQGGASDD
jgi:NADH-quinone oxidoreductase subunit C